MCSARAKTAPGGNQGTATSYSSQPVPPETCTLHSLLQFNKHGGQFAAILAQYKKMRNVHATRHIFVKTLIAVDANVSHIPHRDVCPGHSSKRQASSLWGKKPLPAHIGSLVSDVTRQNITQYSHTATKKMCA